MTVNKIKSLVFSIIVLFSLLSSLTTSLNAQWVCNPPYQRGGVFGTTVGNCNIRVYFCSRYVPTQNVVEIILSNIEMSGSCGCITREEFLQQYGSNFVNHVTNDLLASGFIPGGLPACPLQTMIARVSPTACATDCIATGCYTVWPDGSYGEIYKRFSCTDDISCRYNYSICCNTSVGPCPPNTATSTYLGFEILGNTVQCGVKRIYEGSYCNSPLPYMDLQCNPTCK